MKNAFKRIVVFGVAVCLASFGLAGCAQQTAQEEAAPVAEEQPSFDLIIGTEDEAVVSVPFANGTDQPISGVQVKATSEETFSPNLMEASQLWEPEQVANIFFAGVMVADAQGAASDASSSSISSSAAGAASSATSSAAATTVSSSSASASADDATDLLLNDSYDIQFTEQDGTAFVLHQLVLSSLAEAEELVVNVDPVSGLGYLTFVEGGEDVSTLAAEEEIAAQAAAMQEQAEAQAAIQAEAEAAAAEAAKQSSGSGSGSSSGGSYDSVGSSGSGSGSASGSGSSGGSSKPSQSEDSCVAPDDLIFND